MYVTEPKAEAWCYGYGVMDISMWDAMIKWSLVLN